MNEATQALLCGVTATLTSNTGMVFPKGTEAACEGGGVIQGGGGGEADTPVTIGDIFCLLV